MEKVMPRNDPSSEMMTKDNMQKTMCYIPGVENYAGNESGESTTAGLGTTTGMSAPSSPATYINIDASMENRSAKFKNPQAKQDVPTDARGQYQ